MDFYIEVWTKFVSLFNQLLIPKPTLILVVLGWGGRHRAGFSLPLWC